jgi:hypothetical protein
VKYASIAMDLRVLVRTIAVVLLGQRLPASAGQSASRDERTATPLALPADVTRAHAA